MILSGTCALRRLFMFDRLPRPLLPLAAIAVVAGFAAFSFTGTAQAESVKKECSTKYQAAKAANSLNGQSWTQFYKQCAAEAKAGAEPAATSEPAAAPAAAPAQKTAAPSRSA